MAFYTEKGWWKSRTIWLGLLTSVVGVASLVGVQLPAGVDANTVTDSVMAVVGLVAIVLRFKTDSAIAPVTSTA